MDNLQDLIDPHLPYKMAKNKTIILFFVMMILILFCPWIAFTVGKGQITAINPNERVQSITAPVGGFIKTWYVREGDIVEEGQIIAELVDNDPSLMDRLGRERDAAQAAVKSAQMMMDTAKLDLDRQMKLFNQGLSSRKDYEKARIEFSKLSVEYSKSLATLTKTETQFSRQETQKIISPRKGTIIRIVPGERGTLIKAGSAVAVFAPVVKTPAVELWIDGNDASMLRVGQTAQIQFEGWPAIQIAGWPSLSIGTFRGKVHLVDQASSYEGKFRVLLTPDEKWPSYKILRLGVHAKGYIKLSNSFVLKEIWRHLNGFPPVLEPIKDELNLMFLNKKDSAESSTESDKVEK